MILPQSSTRFRFALIGMGIVTFAWLSLEDTSTVSVMILASLASVLLVLNGVMARAGGQTLSDRLTWLVLPLLGATVGVGAILNATLLMFFKTAWHSHLYPDYPTPMMLATLERAPVWGLSGCLIGLGLVFVTKLSTPKSLQDPSGNSAS